MNERQGYDAVVRAARHEQRGLAVVMLDRLVIRCLTWERAREWVDSLKASRYHASIHWAPSDPSARAFRALNRP